MNKSTKYILIVEDAEPIRSSLSEFLEMEGFSVVAASHGKEALERLETMPVHPAVIMLDLMMPEMDGYKFQKELEKNPQLKAIPIVLMTAGGEVQAKCDQIGAKAHLKKPFTDLNTILEVIRQFV